MHGCIRSGRSWLFAAIGVVAALPAIAADTAREPLARTSDGFCAEGQRLTTATTLPVSNTVHVQYEGFVESKPGVDPLATQQFVEYLDGDRSRPWRVSCKFKSADHIRAVHGAAAATAPDNANACRELHRAIVLAVHRDLDAQERARVVVPPQRFMLDGDDIQVMGSAWTEPFQFAYVGNDGRVHLRSKALLVLWDDWRWKIAPDRFRGTHYCHLAAPEYVRDLMLGRAQAPPIA